MTFENLTTNEIVNITYAGHEYIVTRRQSGITVYIRTNKGTQLIPNPSEQFLIQLADQYHPSPPMSELYTNAIRPPPGSRHVMYPIHSTEQMPSMLEAEQLTPLFFSKMRNKVPFSVSK